VVAVARLSSTAELEALQSEWTRLWMHSPTATPFQAPQWLVPWWQHFGNQQLWTLTFRHEGNLVGVIPLFVYTRPDTGDRELVLLGNGISDYLDGLFARGWEQDCLDTFLEYLSEHREEWDVCDFQQLRSDATLLQLAPPSSWQDTLTVQETCTSMNPQNIPRKQMGNLRNRWRCLQRTGHAQIQNATAQNLDLLLHALFALHDASWENRNTVSVLRDDAVQQFHQKVAPALLMLGALRMYALYLDQRIVAVWHGFHWGARTYFYMHGFNPELAHLSLGSLVVGHAIEIAAQEDAADFDFLRGREPYKKLWGVTEHSTYQRSFRHALSDTYAIHVMSD
jgi:CelD/BcsL family acetyltransferase involved in cellulose biosynthesis